jgi:hypothetical protein
MWRRKKRENKDGVECVSKNCIGGHRVLQHSGGQGEKQH